MAGSGTDTQEYCCAAGVCCARSSPKRIAALSSWLAQHVKGDFTPGNVAIAVLHNFDVLPLDTVDIEAIIKLFEAGGGLYE